MKRNNGFTLIEVLLAAMIVAMMGGSLYATFAAGFKLDHRIRQSFSDLDESRIIIEELRRDLSRAINYDFRGSFPEQKSFLDINQSLVFVIDSGERLRWVRYRLVVEESGEVNSTVLGTTSQKNIAATNIKITAGKAPQTLIREEGDFIQFFNPGSELAADKKEVLTKRVADKGWKISYAPLVAPQTKIEWQDSWKENYLPAAVRVNLLLQNERGQIKKIISDLLLPAGGQHAA